MMKRIPIREAEGIAHKYGYDQVVIIARAVGEVGGEHVTTYGRDKSNCDVAARIGNFLKFKVMQWGDGNVIDTDKRCPHGLSPRTCSDCSY